MTSRTGCDKWIREMRSQTLIASQRSKEEVQKLATNWYANYGKDYSNEPVDWCISPAEEKWEMVTPANEFTRSLSCNRIFIATFAMHFSFFSRSSSISPTTRPLHHLFDCCTVHTVFLDFLDGCGRYIKSVSHRAKCIRCGNSQPREWLISSDINGN